MIWLLPHPLSLFSRHLSFSVFLSVLTGERGRGWRSRIIRQRESPVFYESFDTLWCNLSVYLSPYEHRFSPLIACFSLYVLLLFLDLSDIALVVPACVLWVDICWGYRTHSTVLTIFVWGIPLSYLSLQDWKLRHHEYNQVQDICTVHVAQYGIYYNLIYLMFHRSQKPRKDSSQLNTSKDSAAGCSGNSPQDRINSPLKEKHSLNSQERESPALDAHRKAQPNHLSRIHTCTA